MGGSADESSTRVASAQPGAPFVLGDPRAVLEAFSRHSTDCVRIVDLDGRVLGWNHACELLYGWSASEVLGERLPHVPPADRLRAIRNIRDVAAGGSVVERETIGLRADGSRFALRMTVIPVVDEDGDASGVVSLTHALSDDTRMEREREHFAELISRQVKGPMTAILGCAQLLGHAEIVADEARRERTLRSLTVAAERVSRLLDDLAVVFEFEDGRLELELSRVDVAELVTHVVEVFDTGEANVLVDFDPALGTMKADGVRVGQALACLLDNAVRHTPEGGSVGVSAYADDGDVVIEVVDHGPGIPPSEQALIFDRFHAAETDAGGREGLGIGLYLVRVIADAHGGAVSLVSSPGAGSTFALRLPRTPVAAVKVAR